MNARDTWETWIDPLATMLLLLGILLGLAAIAAVVEDWDTEWVAWLSGVGMVCVGLSQLLFARVPPAGVHSCTQVQTGACDDQPHL